MSKKNIHKSPFYYTKRQFFKNKAALFGMVVICVACLIALLGYLIMPDDTPNANNGAVELKKKLPGFEVTLLKMHKRRNIPARNIFERMLFGQESEYTIAPIKDYEINGTDVLFTPLTREKKKISMPLVLLTYPVFNVQSKKFPYSSSQNFVIEADNVKYLDIHEHIQTVSIAKLQEDFKRNNIEQRTYWLGTDVSGRDLLSLLLIGTRISLSIGLIAVFISTFLGVVLGGISGYFGGWVDYVVMWVMSIIWSIPSIMLVIAITLVLSNTQDEQGGVWVTFVAVGLTMWVEVARVVRGQMITLKERAFVESVRAFGIKSRRIIFRHILPNMLGEIVVISTANFATAILIEAGLSFLGLGIKAPATSWGLMVKDSYHVIGTLNSWHLVIFPSIAISLLVLAFNLFGNGLRDAINPRK